MHLYAILDECSDMQESCSRASDAILRLLSIRDKTRLELHQFVLDVPGAQGGVVEAQDDTEHSVPEPISWNEGLAALSPKTQSQAAQIRGMLQSALQPGVGPFTTMTHLRHGLAWQIGLEHLALGLQMRPYG